MTDPITCNFARCAIHHFTTKHEGRYHRLPKGSYTKILHQYNQHVVDTPALTTTYTVVSKKFQAITKIFGNKWHPNHAKEEFFNTFDLEQWKSTDPQEKCKHTLCGCKECQERHARITHLFPLLHRKKDTAKTSPQISFSPKDLSSPPEFGLKLLEAANSISTTHFQKPIQQVISETPWSRMVLKPSSRMRLSQRWQFLHDIKNQIQTDMNSEGDTLVLQNRLGWNRLDSLRKGLGLSGSKRKRSTIENATPTTKHKHGCHSTNLDIDKDQLLQEARSWQPDEHVNWSQLGLRYGLSKPNRGQIIKKYLAEQGIPAAHNDQCK